MTFKHLLGAAAACALVAGAAHAQPSSMEPGSTAPSGATSGSSSAAPGAANETAPTAPAPGAAAGQPGATPSGAPDMSAGAQSGVGATSAGTYGQGASVTVTTTTNGPVPDTRENRRKYGGPMSRAGRHTAAKGN